jgi:hypothetical protein
MVLVRSLINNILSNYYRVVQITDTDRIIIVFIVLYKELEMEGICIIK